MQRELKAKHKKENTIITVSKIIADVVLPMKSLLIVFSYHHNNTQKVAEVSQKCLMQIKSPQQTNPEELQKYDLVGFGAGIDSGKHYKVLLDFADKLPQVQQESIHFFNQWSNRRKETSQRPFGT